MPENQQGYNAGDAQQVAKARGKAKVREHQKQSGLRKLMSDPEGRVWMWELLSLCGIYHSGFSSDALAMAFNEGRRDIGLRITAEINRLNPEFYARMTAENQPGEK
jgi:hypothetical protein